VTGLRRSRWFAAALAGSWLAALYLVAPLIIVVPVSLTDRRFLSMPQDGLALKHYANIIDNPLWLSSISQSLVVATAATVFAVLLGTLAAIGCWRISTQRSEVARAVLLLPLFIPSIIHALGIYRMWIDVGIIDTFMGVILANVILSLPYVVIAVSASLANFDLRLEQAARNLGASTAQIIKWVILPNIWPGVITGALFSFVHAWDEIVVLLFIAGRKVKLLPRAIWDGVNDAVDPTIAAIATLLIGLTIVILAIERLVRRRQAELVTRQAPKPAGH
jgi:putative spermidine/putrescine transport system permease protein